MIQMYAGRLVSTPKPQSVEVSVFLVKTENSCFHIVIARDSHRSAAARLGNCPLQIIQIQTIDAI